MVDGDTGQKSTATVISELLKASIGIWNSYTKDLDLNNRKQTNRDPYYSDFNKWQADCTKLFLSIQKIYGVGVESNTSAKLDDDRESLVRFQEAFNEFLNLLTNPVKEKFAEFSRMKEDDSETKFNQQNGEQLYQEWMADLEKKYGELLCSKDFTESLQKFIHASGGFSQMREQWLRDAMKTASLPTKTDYDKLLKEVNGLKRQVRALSRKVNPE